MYRNGDPHGCALLVWAVLALVGWVALVAVFYFVLMVLRAVGL